MPWGISCAGCHTPPVHKSGEHDLDAVGPFVSALVVFHRGLALLPACNAGAYPLVFQSFSEPVGIIPSVSEHPFDVWKAAQQRLGADVIADLADRDGQVERSAPAVADCMLFRILATLGSPYQATAPFFDAQTGRRSVGFQVGGGDHHSLLLTVPGRQPDQYLCEDAFIVPVLPTVVERF